MEFRPCIDIHNGAVKQLVGTSVQDEGDQAQENFVAVQDASFYALVYRGYKQKGGHIILLNPVTSPYYEQTKRQAILALQTYPNGMLVGGGITPENASEFLSAGATHVIVTTYVFQDGKINYENLKRMMDAVGKERLVLDLSCRRKGGSYYVATDRWQKFSEEKVDENLLDALKDYADEFLVHGVDVEGKILGIEADLVALLGDWGKIPITYAGGVRNFADLEEINRLGKGKINVSIGSALDLFGGELSYEEVMKWIAENNEKGE